MSTFDVVVEPRTRHGLLRSAAGLPLQAVQAFLAWRRHREGIRQLLELDDRLLLDAGFIRHDIERLR